MLLFELVCELSRIGSKLLLEEFRQLRVVQKSIILFTKKGRGLCDVSL